MPHPATATTATPPAASDSARPAPRSRGWREVATGGELRELLGEPHPVVIDKVHRELTESDRRMLADSPFCVLSTCDSAGDCDASPRGGAPGFVHVLDAATLVLPERSGNRRGDSLRNILENPRVGLLHLVPGSADVLRVNGRARTVADAPFFDALTAGGRRPALAVVIEIDEIFQHCPQSLRRAGVWRPETWRDAPASAGAGPA